MKNNCNKYTKNKQLSATLIGSTAVIMWSILALLTSFANNIPPFQLTAMAFSIASIIGLVFLLIGVSIKEVKTFLAYLKQLKHIWAIGIGGLFWLSLFLLHSTAKLTCN